MMNGRENMKAFLPSYVWGGRIHKIRYKFERHTRGQLILREKMLNFFFFACIEISPGEI